MTKSEQLAQIYEWARKDQDIHEMVNIIVSLNQCTSAADLLENWPDEFDDLWLATSDLVEQLGLVE